MPNTQGVPVTTQAFVDGQQRITIAWYRFLITLWRRTGGALGDNAPDTSSLAGVSNATIQSNVNNLAQLLISATGIVISGPEAGTAKFFNVTGTASLDFVGPGGLDVASSRVPNGVIYLLGISQDGVTLKFLLSAGAFPILPDGYTYATVLGAYVLDGSGDFRLFVQKNDLVIYKNFIDDLVAQDIGQNVAYDFLVTTPPNVLVQGNGLTWPGNSDPSQGQTCGIYFSPTFVPVNVVGGGVNGQMFGYARGTGSSLAISYGAGQVVDILVDEQSKIRAVGYSDSVFPATFWTTTGYRIPFIGLQGIAA